LMIASIFFMSRPQFCLSISVPSVAAQHYCGSGERTDRGLPTSRAIAPKLPIKLAAIVESLSRVTAQIFPR
jgi:hypothetical protein